MATSFNVNLGIQSVLGFKRPSGADPLTGYIFDAPRPVMQTTRTLNGEEFADTGINTSTRVLIVDPLSTFDVTKGKTSTNQTVVLRNYGNATLTVTNVTFTANGVTPVPTFSPETLLTGKIEVPPNSSSTFQLAYFGDSTGDWSNNFLITSNINVTYYRVRTRQSVSRKYSLSVNPANSTTTSVIFGEKVLHRYAVTPVVNLDPLPDLDVDLSVGITSITPGWEIVGIEKNVDTGLQEVVARFKSFTVGSSTGSYTATITISSDYQGIVAYHTATSTVICDVDFSQFENLGSWVSAAASNNSVIGISYDRFGTEKVLTIGVGTGGNGLPHYADGGQEFTATSTLGVLGDATDYPFVGWETVYRFPLRSDGVKAQYFSDTVDEYELPIYRVKSEGPDYTQYFGRESSLGSMFVLDDDGYGNVEITVNNLRDIPTDPDEAATMQNLTRAFFYYSGVDVGGRFYQLETSPILDGTVTHRLIGFGSSGRPLTSIVPLPTSN